MAYSTGVRWVIKMSNLQGRLKGGCSLKGRPTDEHVLADRQHRVADLVGHQPLSCAAPRFVTNGRE